MPDADARKVRNFRAREDFLARFDGDHDSSLCDLRGPFCFHALDDDACVLRMGVTTARSVRSESCRFARKIRALKVPDDTPSAAQASAPDSSP